jgi:Arc/MetJ-type ribon-helix-helix transcriptional regulator
VETISLKLTSEQARLLERATKDAALPSKSEFVRYAIARALEERLSVETIQEVFEGRGQIRAGRTVSLRKLKAEV